MIAYVIMLLESVAIVEKQIEKLYLLGQIIVSRGNYLHVGTI